MFKHGDILLVKLTGGRSSKPSTPSGRIYSDTTFHLFGGAKPVYSRYDVGDVAPVRLMKHKGGLSARGHESGKSNKIIHKEFIQILNRRQGKTSSVVQLPEPSEDPVKTVEIKEEQEKQEKKSASDDDSWSESKSDKLKELRGI